jgi:hypothetical protein
MLERVAIEPDWYEGGNERVIARSEEVLSIVREIIRAAEALHEQLATQAAPSHIRAAADAARAAVAGELERYAAGLQTEPPSAIRPASMSPATFGLPVGVPGSVAWAAQELLRHLGGLPDWSQPVPEPVTAREPLPP